MAADCDTTIGAVVESVPDGLQFRIRRLRNSDGGVLWESVHPVLMPDPPQELPGGVHVALGDGDDDSVAVLYSMASNVGMPPIRDAVVATFDQQTGALRWQRSLLDDSDGYTDVHAYRIDLDTAGNVMASVHEVRRASFPTNDVPNRRQIRKYAAADGEELLRIDFPSIEHFQVHSPPLMRGVGDDLLVGQLPGATEIHGLARIGGMSGQTLWHRADIDFPYWGAFGASVLIDATRMHAYSNGHPFSVSALDLQTGNADWSVAYADPRDLGYVLASIHQSAEGQLYAGGYRRIPRPGSATAWDSRGFLMSVDTNSASLSWVNRFEENPTKSFYGLIHPTHVDQGIVYSWQRQQRSANGMVHFLTGVSVLDGHPRGTQRVLFSGGGFEEAGVLSIGNPHLVTAAVDRGLVIQTDRQLPGRSSHFELTKVPAPGIHAGGSIKVSLATRAVRTGNQSLAEFEFDVVNSGALDATDVEALLDFPPSSLGNLTCEVAGTPCTPVSATTWVGLRHDLAVGEHIRMTGTLQTFVQPGYDLSLYASAFAPYGFVEMDMKDNTRSFPLGEGLLLHGFD